MRRILGTILFATACGDGDSDAPAADTSSSTTATTTSSSSTTIADPDTSSDSSTATTSDASSSGSAPDTCTEPPADDPCLRCGFEQCSDAYASCCALTELDADGVPTTGCLPLVSCALATGCVHATCYQPDTCMA